MPEMVSLTITPPSPRSTEMPLWIGEIAILAWRLPRADPLCDLSDNLRVSDQRVNGGNRTGSDWTMVSRPIVR
jgi:hypothetical protein